MALTVNTNIMSLNAQRNLGTSEKMLSQSLQRLSSGLRINSAKDDAAGLAIAERFSTQIRGINQAVRNANDGISLAQTSESALNEVVNNLQRIRELAVQSANATNSASDRGALDAEVQQRIAEIERIATQTAFNGRTVLDGTFGTAVFQVGANVGETIGIDLSTGVRASQIGQIASDSATVNTGGIPANTVSINGSFVAASVADDSLHGQTADSAYAKAQAINASGLANVTATASSGTVASDAANEGVTFGDAADAYSLVINGEFVVNRTGADGDFTQSELVDKINVATSLTGVTASVNTTTNNIELTAADGRDIIVDETLVEAGAIATTAAFTTDSTTRGSITLSSPTGNIDLVDTGDLLGFGGSTTITLDTQTLNDIDITTVGNAENTMNRVDSALAVVSGLRSDLGAIQSRFESTISNLGAVVENLEASRSRIQDADFAAETAALTKAQILQQAGVAVLSQANATPQAVLGLLQ